jgi:hypothetical protein
MLLLLLRLLQIPLQLLLRRPLRLLLLRRRLPLRLLLILLLRLLLILQLCKSLRKVRCGEKRFTVSQSAVSSAFEFHATAYAP